MVIPRTAVNQGINGIMNFASNVMGRSNNFANGGLINTNIPKGNTNIMGNDLMENLVNKLDAIRLEISQTGFAVAKNTNDIQKIAKRWDIQGLPSTRTT